MGWKTTYHKHSHFPFDPGNQLQGFGGWGGWWKLIYLQIAAKQNKCYCVFASVEETAWEIPSSLKESVAPHSVRPLYG